MGQVTTNKFEKFREKIRETKNIIVLNVKYHFEKYRKINFVLKS